MTEPRLKWLLIQIDTSNQWPRTASIEERLSLVDLGFADEEEDGVYLTSLGELECGCPETGEKGDK
jgi:hypothetical protein